MKLRTKPIWTKTFGICYKVLKNNERHYWRDSEGRLKFPYMSWTKFKSPRQINKTFEPRFICRTRRSSIWTNEK